jgi:amidophosphoribosyltransferase
MARDAGANKVYMASAAPPVRYPNVYGIDMPSREEFIATGRSVEDIAREIGADWLVYQDLEDLEEAVRKGNKTLQGFDSSCFNGRYVTNDVDENYFDHLEKMRSDAAKEQREYMDNLAGIDLYSSQ